MRIQPPYRYGEQYDFSGVASATGFVNSPTPDATSSEAALFTRVGNCIQLSTVVEDRDTTNLTVTKIVIIHELETVVTKYATVVEAVFATAAAEAWAVRDDMVSIWGARASCGNDSCVYVYYLSDT